MPHTAALARDLPGWFDLDGFLEYPSFSLMTARCQVLCSYIGFDWMIAAKSLVPRVLKARQSVFHYTLD
jgi:hypothetical protein